MEERIGQGVLQFGIAKLVEEVYRNRSPSQNSLEWVQAVLEELESDEEELVSSNRVVPDPVQAIEAAKEAMEQGGRRQVRALCEDWTPGDCWAVLRQLSSMYSGP